MVFREASGRPATRLKFQLLRVLCVVVVLPVPVRRVPLPVPAVHQVQAAVLPAQVLVRRATAQAPPVHQAVPVQAAEFALSSVIGTERCIRVA